MAKTQVKEILQSNDTKKEKFDYLWEYYKWHVIGTIAAILFVIYIIVQMLTRPQVSFNIGVLGPETTSEQEQALSSDLKQLMDPEDVEGDMFVTVTPEGQMAERFFAQLTAAEYDLILMSEVAFENFASDQSMQGIDINGIDEGDLRYAEKTENVIGISTNAVPFFNNHDATQDMIVMVPQNARHKDQTVRFFEAQGIDLSE
ncbi:hypothetical protein [Marinilactibacillus sp. Marseille-P9653]|uniref:hypothetical protein n=1 Tax=Marinilactibacillus sp. Marseille-P9653 TaxID=2866583 RepID=UPI001CE45D84|nr:hypothetical protein [Marinilactibacillus sp. Marseille-P9653]